jgi:hypothetical protein
VKTNGFKPLDGVVDSMGAAASRLGVPLETVKMAKRTGCDAFRGSRVHLGKLREWLASAEKEPSTSDFFLMIVQDVAQIVAEKLLHYRDARFRADSRKLTEAIHNGFAAALVVVEPDGVDQFLQQSAALMENTFKSARKKLAGASQSTEKEWQRRK